MKKVRMCTFAAVVIGASAPLHAEDLYGSIAFSQETDGGYAWGIAWNAQGDQGARADSLDKCQAVGGQACQEIAAFRESCGALVIWRGGGFSAAWGTTQGVAVRDALAECRGTAAKCRVEVARCGASQEVSGPGAFGGAGQWAESAGADVPAAVAQDGICPGISEFGQPVWFNCWTELSNQPGCYFWYADWTQWIGYPTHESARWSGTCHGGMADGEGVLTGASNRDFRWSVSHAGSLSKGRKHGRWVETRSTERGHTREEGVYVNGSRDGEWIVDHWAKCETITYPVSNWSEAKKPCQGHRS